MKIFNNIFLRKKILIYGLGKSGLSSYNFLKNKESIKLSKTSSSNSIEFYRNKGLSVQEIKKKINKIEPFPL